jgi:polyisoprenoid-binding protein YceI
MESVRIEKGGADAYRGTFRLGLKGMQREVTVPFTLAPHGQGGRFAGTFTINRLDFGLGKTSLILADEVTVHVTVHVNAAVLRPAPR